MDKEQLNGALDQFLMRLIDTADKALTAGEEAVAAATGLVPEVLKQLIHWKIAEQLILLSLCMLSLLLAYKLTKWMFRYFKSPELDPSKVDVKTTIEPGDYLQLKDGSIRGPVLRIDSDGDFVTNTPNHRYTRSFEVNTAFAPKAGFIPPRQRNIEFDIPVTLFGGVAVALAILFPLLAAPNALFTLAKLHFAPYVYLIDYIRAM